MAAEVIFNSNLHEFLDEFESRKSRILLDIGVTIQDEAATNSPVRTGTLRKSWTVEVSESGNYVIVGVPADDPAAAYARFVENGTSRQRAQHMLRNAVNNRRGEFPMIARVDMVGMW